MTECAVLFSDCNDPERWKQMQSFSNRIHSAVDGKSQAEVHVSKSGDMLWKLQIDEEVVDFIRMVANDCDCDEIVFHDKIIISPK